jgi:hypothetical protein
MSGIRLPLDVPEVAEENWEVEHILSRGVNPLSDEQKRTPASITLRGRRTCAHARGVFRKAADKNLLVHFSAYRAKGSQAPVIAKIEFLQGEGSIKCDRPTTACRCQRANRLSYIFPSKGFQPVSEIRVTVMTARLSQLRRQIIYWNRRLKRAPSGKAPYTLVF